jgi:anti-sigma-K factor RskA
VDIKEYISSGVLELYVFGQLSEAEQREVEAMCAAHPEVQAELEAVQETVNGYAGAHRSHPAPALRTKILDSLDLKDAEEPKVIAMTPAASSGSSYRWLAAASVALFIVSLGVNVYLYNNYKSVSGQLAELQTKNSVLADNNAHLTKQLNVIGNDLAVMSSPSNVKIQLNGLPLSPAAKALIFWDNQRKETYINTSQLPPLAESKQYQLWAIVDGKPVDLGVLPTDMSVATLIKMKDVSAPQAFAITIEPKGGSVGPTLDQMIVMGKVL